MIRNRCTSKGTSGSKLAKFLAMLDTRMTTLGPLSWHLRILPLCPSVSKTLCIFAAFTLASESYLHNSGSDIQLNDCPCTEGFDVFIFVMLQPRLTPTKAKVKQPKPHYSLEYLESLTIHRGQNYFNLFLGLERSLVFSQPTLVFSSQLRKGIGHG